VAAGQVNSDKAWNDIFRLTENLKNFL